MKFQYEESKRVEKEKQSEHEENTNENIEEDE